MAPSVVKELQTFPADPPAADTSQGMALMVERLAANPGVDVAKLEKILEMQERVLRYNAEAAFNAAFSRMQPEIPVIDEHGRIEVKGTLRSTYAPLSDIHDVIKPITARYGFAIRHRTEWPADKPGTIRIVGILSHEQGHREETVFEAAMDKSDYRTDIQSTGSTVSYGRRYTTLDLLNISTRKADNDGRGKMPPPPPTTPPGYDEWLIDLTACADEGDVKLRQMWEGSKTTYRAYLTKTQSALWATLKAKALQVGLAKGTT